MTFFRPQALEAARVPLGRPTPETPGMGDTWCEINFSDSRLTPLDRSARDQSGTAFSAANFFRRKRRGAKSGVNNAFRRAEAPAFDRPRPPSSQRRRGSVRRPSRRQPPPLVCRSPSPYEAHMAYRRGGPRPAWRSVNRSLCGHPCGHAATPQSPHSAKMLTRMAGPARLERATCRLGGTLALSVFSNQSLCFHRFRSTRGARLSLKKNTIRADDIGF